jgi:hypothetical protein
VGRQLPVDIVIKKLHKMLGTKPLLCKDDDRIQITEEGNGNLFASFDHNVEKKTTWLRLFSDELEMDFDVKYNEKTGAILRDKNVKAVNAMIKFTTPEAFVDTLFEKFTEFSEEVLVTRNAEKRHND